MIVVKEMTKETVRTAVRKAAQMLRKTDFAPSTVLSVGAVAVVTFDVSPKISANPRHGGGPCSIKSKLGGFVEV